MNIRLEEIKQKFRIRPSDFNANEIGCYLDLDADKSFLDGVFTADELRRVANAMDELKRDFLNVA